MATMSRMIKTAACIVLFIAFCSADANAGRKCIMLGWTGGAAEDGVKWVRGSVTQSGEVVHISYDWKHGVMTGRVQKDGTLSGTWIQDGDDGGRFHFKMPTSGQAKGWWSSNSDNNRKRAAMIIQNCD